MTHPTRHSWYRRTTWSPADQQDFEARLNRARQKSQYLLLQASTLVGTGNPELIATGLGLVDRMITEHPDPFFLSNAYLTRAEALVSLRRAEEAVIAFRGALTARRELPNVVNYAYLEFAWTVARLELRQFYDEVLAVLKEFQQASDLAFPINAFRYFGAIALIMAERGQHAEAQRQAKAALQAISEARGPFSRHPTFGVVNGQQIDPSAHRRLWSLAAV